MKRPLFRLFCFSVLAACCGCVERTLLIQSEPPGAAVIVNGADAGMTPVRLDFTTYGVFDVVASAPRCERLRTKVPVEPPWYEKMPMDFFAEVVWPFTVRDDHEVTLALKPLQEGGVPGLNEREKQLRERAVQSTEKAAEPQPQ